MKDKRRRAGGVPPADPPVRRARGSARKVAASVPGADVINAILAREADAAGKYHRLSEDSRRSVIASLDASGLRTLTALLKQAKKAAFKKGDARFLAISRQRVQTPVYLIDETLIEENMRIARYVKDRTGCKILHALKAYASFATFPMMRKYLDGTCASGLNEARLGREEFGGEVHTFAAAFREGEIGAILKYSDAIVFNSFYQLRTYGKAAREKGLSIGVRVNPGHAEVATEMYNPCAPCSRLGITHRQFETEFPKYRRLVDGLHFHAMCEQGSDVLMRILDSFEKLYAPYMEGLRWVNFGGGHHMSRDDYDIELLIRLVTAFKKKHGVQVYLEPGESSVYHAGVLISSVLDIVKNDMEIAIIDASAEAHMPDVLFMPYRPHIMGSGEAGRKKHTYRIAGPTCLAGDVVGDYSFSRPLKRGDKLVFTDMALYSIVKSTTFNGINLPDIAVAAGPGDVRAVRRFGYRDYRDRQS